MEKTHIIEKTFTSSNKTCVVTFSSLGHRCGYVAVEKDSPLYGIDYYDLCTKHNYSPNIHGGLTFSTYSSLYPITTKRPLFWFGFDCAHLYDTKDFEAVKKYFGLEKYNQILESYARFNAGTIKTLDFCITECKYLATQLTIAENTIKDAKQ